MDHYIKSGKLSKFIRFLLEQKVQDRKAENEQKAWELWLHKVFDKSYKEFSETIKHEEDMRKKAFVMTKEDINKAANVAVNTLKLLGGGAS